MVVNLVLGEGLDDVAREVPDFQASNLAIHQALPLQQGDGCPLGEGKTVTDKLVAIHDELGGFGTLLITQKDWDNPAIHKKSMRLLAEKVMPVLRQHAASAMAAE